MMTGGAAAVAEGAVGVASARQGAANAALCRIDGRPIAWFRLAEGDHRGAIGPVEGQVIERLVDLALETGVPVVGEVATSGADVGHGVASLHAWGRVAAALTRASGTVPVILCATGPCVGGPALLLGLADHVIMTSDAFAYLSGPGAVADFTGQQVTREDLGGAGVHSRRSGLASVVVDDAEEAVWAAADILSYLPSNFLDEVPLQASSDPVDRPSRVAAEAVPASTTASYDVRSVVADVCDTDSFMEVRGQSAANVVVGYARLGGRSVGVVANQPSQLAGTLDIEASRKAARFVQSCDAFGLPICTFVDCPGYQPGKDLEWRGIIRHGAQLVQAYAEATVPRLCVVMRKAYGGAFIVLDSKGLGNDVCLAWPTAEIAVMGAPGAVQILHGRRLAKIDDAEARAAEAAELEADYRRRLCTPTVAAERGYVDAVIEPLDTRRLLTAALAVLSSKRAERPRPRRPRHSNGPL